MLDFYFHYPLDSWYNSQTSAEVTVSLGAELTCLRSISYSHRFLEELCTFGTLWKLYTYLFAVLLSKWKLQLLKTSLSRSLIFVFDRSFSFSWIQIRLLRRRLSFNLYDSKFHICILSVSLNIPWWST